MVGLEVGNFFSTKKTKKLMSEYTSISSTSTEVIQVSETYFAFGMLVRLAGGITARVSKTKGTGAPSHSAASF